MVFLQYLLVMRVLKGGINPISQPKFCPNPISQPKSWPNPSPRKVAKLSSEIKRLVVLFIVVVAHLLSFGCLTVVCACSVAAIPLCK